MKDFRNSKGWIVPSGNKKLKEYVKKHIDPDDLDFIDEDETTRTFRT